MNKEKRRVPKLRFPGFTEDWEQRKLGEFVKIVSGDAPSTFISGNCIYVKVDDLNYSDRIQLSSSNLVNANSKAHLVNQGATIFPKRGAAIMTNKVRIMGKDGYLDTNMMALIPEEIDKDFLFTFIQKTGLYKIADTSTIPQINNKHIEPYIIQVPSEKEQAYIGVVFEKIDKIITLHQRKLEHLNLKKKALLQKLFPKNGERHPELRFPGFTDAWEQRKLSEVVTINPKTELPDEFKYVDLESVVGTNLLGFKVIKKENAPSRAQRLASYGDVFYQTVRPYQRNNYLFENVDKDVVFSTGYAQLRSKLDSYFLLTLVQNDNFVKVVLDNCTGTSYPAINGSELGKITVQIPSNEVEANQIGKVFRGIDKSITLHQRKLEHLQLQKKALLQQMFV
ncbi:MAG: restriction endonuclease subunit S [Veillonella sp.]|nr:restriction endonuclease subunit S [Veillonella sp.]